MKEAENRGMQKRNASEPIADKTASIEALREAYTKQFARFPRNAYMALVARIVRRVQPLYRGIYVDSGDWMSLVLEHAISAVEAAAGGANLQFDKTLVTMLEERIKKTDQPFQVSDHVIRSVCLAYMAMGHEDRMFGLDTLISAAAAADLVSQHVKTPSLQDWVLNVVPYFAPVAGLASLTLLTGNTKEPLFLNAIRDDVATIARLVEMEKADDDTRPVSLRVLLGPLWPHGTPKWVVESGASDRNLLLEEPGRFTLGREKRFVSEPVPEKLQQFPSLVELLRVSSAIPQEYPLRREFLLKIADAARADIAQLLEPALNAHAASLPQDSYEEKKTLAKWVNAELRRFGLAIKDPKSGHPCILVGSPGNHPSTGRFMLNYTDSKGQLRHAITSVTLPHLEIIPDDLTRGNYRGKPTHSR